MMDFCNMPEGVKLDSI